MKPSFDDVRLILLRHWDPIGVTGFPSYNEATEDEYDSYALSLAKMMNEGASEADVLSYLKWAEAHIGLPFSPTKAQQTASLILSARKPN